jgi:hypothetical protein
VDQVQEIEAAIQSLLPEEFRRLTKWLWELEQARWDEQMDRDSAAGKLDFLFQEAEANQGEAVREWPPQK